MIINIRKWLQRAQFIMIFLMLTFVLHVLLNGLSLWVKPSNPFPHYTDNAERVFLHDATATGTMDAGGIKERLKLFYWLGE